MAIALCSSGILIQYSSAAVLLVPALAHGLAAVLALAGPGRPVGSIAQQNRAPAEAAGKVADIELLKIRTLALWVSRLALTGNLWRHLRTYANDALAARDAAARTTHPDSRRQRLAGRAVDRIHPPRDEHMVASSPPRDVSRIMAHAAGILGMTIPPSAVLQSITNGPTVDLVSLIAWQAVLGASLGVTLLRESLFRDGAE